MNLPKKRLLFVHDSFDYRGGGEQMLLQVAQVAGREFAIDLALLWGDGRGVLTREEASQLGTIYHLGFPHQLRPSSLAPQMNAARQLRSLVRAGGYDGAMAFSLRSAVRLASAAGRAVPTGWMCQQSFPLFEAPAAPLKRWLGLGAMRRAGMQIVCISERSREDFQRCGIPQAQLHLIRNGIDFEKFQSTPRQASDVFTIVCIARLDPIKNHPVLLRAHAELHRRGLASRLLMVGGPLPHNRQWASKLAILARELGAPGVEWIGETGDVRPYLAQAHVAALTSHQEAMGLVLAEAGAAGLPLVGARIGGIPEVIEDGVCGATFSPDDHYDLADQLEKLARSPELATRYGKAARARVRNLYNQAEQDAAWARFFSQLTRQQKQRSLEGMPYVTLRSQ